MQKIVVCGQSQLTQSVVATLLQSQLVLNVALSAQDPEAIGAQSFAVLSALNLNDYQKATAKTFETADVLVITDYGAIDAPEWQAQMLAQLRKVLGTAMAAGFGGKLLVATHDNALMTYFAQRFSGLPKPQVVGLGTMGATAVFENAVAASLAVPRAEVTAYVVGDASAPVLMWSRAYVAATPLLSLLQTADGQAHPLLQQADAAVNAFGQADAAILWPPLVVQVLTAFAGEAQILALNTFQESGVCAAPVLVNAEGASESVNLIGSDAEQTAWQAEQAALAQRIAAIENGGETE